MPIRTPTAKQVFEMEVGHFLCSLVDELSKYYREKILNPKFKNLFAEHRSRTAAAHYVVNDLVFFESGNFSRVQEVRFAGMGVKLDDDLYEHHVTWWEDYSQFDQDKKKIAQTLHSILLRAENWQDVRDMLPNHVQNIIQYGKLQDLSRTRPDLFAGLPTSSNYTQELIDRGQYWPMQLISMYSKIGGSIATYLGYKLL